MIHNRKDIAEVQDQPGVKVGLMALLGSLSAAMDMLGPAVVGHHRRVAYIALHIARSRGIEHSRMGPLLCAGVLHDVGAFAMSLADRLNTLRFDTENVRHAEDGYRLLMLFPDFDEAARMVRWHHSRWDVLKDMNETPDTALGANVLHLADRVDIITRRCADPEEARGKAREAIAPQAGLMFEAGLVESFDHLCRDRDFWRDLFSPRLLPLLREAASPHDEILDLDRLELFTGLFSQIIDFRSRFTATHSSGVAATASAMAETAGWSDDGRRKISVAGRLHDIGKLAIPLDILDKPGKLDHDEFAVIRRHPEYGDALLSAVPGLERINSWASRHHERLDGTGYHKGLGKADLDQGARIMAVADVFTALTEDRPYRAGMSRRQALDVVHGMAGRKALDPEAVDLLGDDFDRFNKVRIKAQATAKLEFEAFFRALSRHQDALPPNPVARKTVHST